MPHFQQTKLLNFSLILENEYYDSEMSGDNEGSSSGSEYNNAEPQCMNIDDSSQLDENRIVDNMTPAVSTEVDEPMVSTFDEYEQELDEMFTENNVSFLLFIF